MAKLIPALERIKRAKGIIQKARSLARPADAGWQDFSYVAQVKDLMKQARDLVQFIPNSPGASDELKDEAKALIDETRRAEKEILDSKRLA